MSAKRSMSRALTREESYQDGHLTRTAFISIAILTFITFVGNFTQLQLSAALRRSSVIWYFRYDRSVADVDFPAGHGRDGAAYGIPYETFFDARNRACFHGCVHDRFTVRLAWSTFLMVLIGRLLEAVGTGVMWPVLQITVFSIYPLSRRGFAMGTVGMAMSVAPAIGRRLAVCRRT